MLPSRLLHRRLTRLLLWPLALLCLSACSVALQSSRTYPEIAPTPILPGPAEGVWQGPDLQVAYHGRVADASFHLEGKLLIDDRVRYSFPVVLSFFLELVLLDGNGHIIAFAPVTVPFSHFEFVRREYPISLTIPLIDGAENFSFRYSGTFSDYGERRPHREYIEYQPGR